MKILITGGAGFIGSHTTERFLSKGHEVRVLDNFSTGRKSNLAHLENQVDILEADVLDFDRLGSACRDIEVILHLAAVSSVEKSIQEPLLTHSVNSTGSLNVIEAARQAGVRRVILASSAAVYGDHPELPKKESSPVQPQSPYAWHKLSGEFYGKMYREIHELEFAALRYFNVYGPRQDPQSPYSGVLSIFIERALRDEGLIIHGDGSQTRDFIQVSDVAMVNLLAAETPWPLPPIMNVGTGRETRISDAALFIIEASRSQAGIVHGHPRAGDIHRSFADPGLLQKTLGFDPRTSIDEGLRDLVATNRDNPYIV